MARKHAAEWLFDDDAPRIVAIARARGNAVLHLSNDTTLTVSGTALSLLTLALGDTLDAAAKRRILEAEAVADAVRKGVRLLAASAKTAVELRDRLLAKDLDPSIVARALEHLAARGLLSDAEIAARVSNNPTASRDMARHALESRGVDPSLVEETLSKRAGDAAAARHAVRTLDARLPKSLTSAARRQRLLAALARRGFEEQDATDAVDQHLARNARTE